ncbi:flagellar protein export ATPase FliI [Cellulosilyticum lentocellum]|uniref:ATPase, FliI/YscN family n=1 Tax=Cellulosilyticum lentocellum (strain ATCC 49066 / DSM 5427 / NCIMB 11756 / RHM5) TaxID=642492 RepID=F2JGS1_CELLD|nr:flagellar protein export ATPase FliI [Cellulosilyticum lentocellum]ADZ84163.1 ATPase, FliI/YscN family [Cellulosilyticum lentocellum DSM 5427]
MIDFKRYEQATKSQLWTYKGRVTRVVGMSIETLGPIANIGDICYIQPRGKKELVTAEVVGFKDEYLLLMPLGNLEGIGPGCEVLAYGDKLSVKVDESLLGKVVDWRAKPINGDELHCRYQVPIDNTAPNPLTRNRITIPLQLGVRAIDGMLTVGKGQRIGIFAGSGVGKSTLMGMIARNALSDINIIALIGERGREVREFIENDLQAEGLKRSIVVVATSDQPALMRLKAAMTATALAEHFRAQGKDVLLMMDSLTRFSMAQREIGLAIGEPPVSRGYTPSVFAQMPKLLERAGNSDKGSITGMYTVLVDGDDFNEPITDTARGILDGHIVLSRKLANKGHYPAIDVLASISRVMSNIVSDQHKTYAREIKKHMAVYKEAEDLINVGAYNKGSSEEIDAAIDKMKFINEFLCQSVGEKVEFENTLHHMQEIIS